MIYGCELVHVYVYMRIWFKSYKTESCLCVRACVFNALYGTSFLFRVCLSGFLGQRQLNFFFFLFFSLFSFHMKCVVEAKSICQLCCPKNKSWHSSPRNSCLLSVVMVRHTHTHPSLETEAEFNNVLGRFYFWLEMSKIEKTIFLRMQRI